MLDIKFVSSKDQVADGFAKAQSKILMSSQGCDYEGLLTIYVYYRVQRFIHVFLCLVCIRYEIVLQS
jgi:hypothetical protein